MSGDVEHPEVAEASRVIKEHAAKQQIRIELTEDQVASIIEQWEVENPQAPAEITFFAGERGVANIKVAGYWYRGDTCCV